MPLYLYYRPDARVNLRIGSENAKDCKGTKEETLALESLGLVARLDGLLGPSLGIGKVDKANEEGEHGDGDDLAVHASIIAHSPAYATPCTSFHAHFCLPNPLPPMHLGHRTI